VACQWCGREGCAGRCPDAPELPPAESDACDCGCGRPRAECVAPTGYRRSRAIRPLAPGQAGRSLASRLAPVADNLRQLNTTFGVRPYRVFLTWTRWEGTEIGEGYEVLKQRIELLPTPLVKENMRYAPWHGGVLQEGAIDVSEVSVVAYTEDILRGLDPKLIPGLDLMGANPTIPEPWDFFYEVVQDGRGGKMPERPRFRLNGCPFLKADSQEWVMTLERTSRQRTRKDRSVFGPPEGPR
jgi:hypothetical protein